MHLVSGATAEALEDPLETVDEMVLKARSEKTQPQLCKKKNLKSKSRTVERSNYIGVELYQSKMYT